MNEHRLSAAAPTEDVRSLFEKDRFATENGASIELVGDHYALCRMMLSQRHKNAMGAVMGGVPFTLADFAFAVASNWQTPGTVSLSSNITFLSSPKGTVLTAEAVCIKQGRTTDYYQVDVWDDAGVHVAAVTVTGYHKEKRADR